MHNAAQFELDTPADS